MLFLTKKTLPLTGKFSAIGDAEIRPQGRTVIVKVKHVIRYSGLRFVFSKDCRDWEAYQSLVFEFFSNTAQRIIIKFYSANGEAYHYFSSMPGLNNKMVIKLQAPEYEQTFCLPGYSYVYSAKIPPALKAMKAIKMVKRGQNTHPFSWTNGNWQQ